MGPAAAEPQGVGRLRRSGDANFLGGTGANRGVVDVPGQEGFEVIGAGSLWKFGKEARDLGMRLDAVRLRRFDQRVQAGTRGGAGGGLTEEPVWERAG